MQRFSKDLGEEVQGRVALDHEELAEEEVLPAGVLHQGKLLTPEQLLVGTPVDRFVFESGTLCQIFLLVRPF